MLVQPRPDGLRLIRQHDHALAAGALAHAWRLQGEGRLPHLLVLTITLHDVAWTKLDDEPRWDPDTGRPFAFDAHPLAEKLEAYRRGLDRMTEVHPYVGLLGSLHYASFLDPEQAPDFLEGERRRRRGLVERLEGKGGGAARRDREAGDDTVGDGGPHTGTAVGGGDPRPEATADGGGGPVSADSGGVPARARRELRWLKFFDGLSLRLCLAPPPVPDDELPPWLERAGDVEAPDGARLTLAWEGASRARLDPWPFRGGTLELELPARELGRRRFPDAAALREAWEGAGDAVWRLTLAPGG